MRMPVLSRPFLINIVEFYSPSFSIRCFPAPEHHVIGAKQLVKNVSKACMKCQRHYAKATDQLMAQLPVSRVTQAPPFTNTGADFARPFTLRKGHTSKPVWLHGYLCLFVCLTTRSIHLELVMDLTTEAFLAAFPRFVARQEWPATLLTDNGTNIVGAHRELAAYKVMDLEHPDESLSNLTAAHWCHSTLPQRTGLRCSHLLTASSRDPSSHCHVSQTHPPTSLL